MMLIDRTKFTDTELRIINMLQDGRVHSYDEIRSVCFDELTSTNTVRMHISNIRRKVVGNGLLITYSLSNGRGYQMSRRISKGE